MPLFCLGVNSSLYPLGSQSPRRNYNPLNAGAPPRCLLTGSLDRCHAFADSLDPWAVALNHKLSTSLCCSSGEPLPRPRSPNLNPPEWCRPRNQKGEKSTAGDAECKQGSPK